MYMQFPLMAETTQSATLSYESPNIPALFSLPNLPTFLAEWAGAIPLVIYLVSVGYNYRLVGLACLRGKLDLNLFPRLGEINSLFNLLNDGVEFCDRAATGDNANVVYDVNWGSVFPSANGASLAVIFKFAARKLMTTLLMPETPIQAHETSEEEVDDDDTIDQADPSGETRMRSDTWATKEQKTTVKGWRPGKTFAAVQPDADGFRRYQLLNVLHFDRVAPRRSITSRIEFIIDHPITWCIRIGFYLAIIGALIYVGCYGTAAVIIASSTSQLLCRRVLVGRPSTYLRSTGGKDGCMLVACHNNASIWNLCIGDRGIIDSLLNKPMITMPEAHIAVSMWIKIAHYTHVLAMCFVAGQKGWDAIAMVVLMAFSSLTLFLMGPDYTVKNWMDREGIEVHIQQYRFGGRYQMFGAIQIFNGKDITSWMDDVLVPSSFREHWLNSFFNAAPAPPVGLNAADKGRAEYQAKLAVAAADVLKKSMAVKRTEPSVRV